MWSSPVSTGRIFRRSFNQTAPSALTPVIPRKRISDNPSLCKRCRRLLWMRCYSSDGNEDRYGTLRANERRGINEHITEGTRRSLHGDQKDQSANTDNSRSLRWRVRQPRSASSTKGSRFDYRTESQTRLDTELSDLLPPATISHLNDLNLDRKNLEFEADVCSRLRPGPRLVDDPSSANNLQLWKGLLAYRRRIHGSCGVRDIWYGMRSRHIDLPVDEADDASFLWRTFIEAAVPMSRTPDLTCYLHESYLGSFVLYANELYDRKGVRWPLLYTSIVPDLFARNQSGLGLTAHRMLVKRHLLQPNDVLTLLAPSLKEKNGLRLFRRILKDVHGHKIHGQVIPYLLKRRKPMDALTMHHFLAQRDDLPTRIEDIEPLIKFVEKFSSDMDYEILMRSCAAVSSSEFNDTRKVSAPGRSRNDGDPGETTKDLDTSVLSPYVKEKTFDDGLGARLFATKAFTHDIIVSGLKMFGIVSIGPLSLREMALRAQNARTVDRQIKALQDAGISIGNSVFSKVVKQLAAEGSERLLYTVLHSDQHPDVLENLEMQEAFLTSYHLEQAWDQVNKTLVILSHLKSEDPFLCNIRLRNSLRSRNWNDCRRFLESMKERNVVPSRRTVNVMVRNILPRRTRARRPGNDRGSTQAVSFLLSWLQHIACNGADVPAWAWREPLRRLGMSNRWEELRTICHWLAHFYAVNPQKLATRGGKNYEAIDLSTRPVSLWDKKRDSTALLAASHPSSKIRSIFSVGFQRAIAVWGFLLRLSPGIDSRRYRLPFPGCEDQLVCSWVRGVVLLRELKEMGVVVQVNTVRRASRQRLSILYGKQIRESVVQRNRLLRRENDFALGSLLQDLDKAWRQPVFPEYEGDYATLVNPALVRKSPKYRQRQALYDEMVWRQKMRKRRLVQFV